MESDNEKDCLYSLIEIDYGAKIKYNPHVLDNLCSQIGDRKSFHVAIISTTGERTGKTFWNNVLLHALQNDGRPFEDEETLGGVNGFCFKNGMDAHTKGIMAYPKVFFKMIDGEEVAIVLLDTQRIYDLQTSIVELAAIFRCSISLASTQIFNCKGFLGANYLDDLNLFIDFSRGEDERPGQNFAILLRDIPDAKSDGKIYGINKEYLEQIKESKFGEMVKGVYDAFETVECAMIPRPNDPVRNCSGEIKAKDCGRSFLNTLHEYAVHVINTVRPKKFKGVPLTGPAFRTHFENICAAVKEKCDRGLLED